MRNIETSIVGDILTIKVDLSKPSELSSSGKEEVKLGINIYTKKT